VERHAILDERLVGSPEIYFGAGDHVALVHVSGTDFLKLMADAPRGQISWHV
jgi:prolyl-tRNA editing enzyme YbaK/EbsC (Cys-tRNA(Pro) deacylase)